MNQNMTVYEVAVVADNVLTAAVRGVAKTVVNALIGLGIVTISFEIIGRIGEGFRRYCRE
jgi:hypothetical protein